MGAHFLSVVEPFRSTSGARSERVEPISGLGCLARLLSLLAELAAALGRRSTCVRQAQYFRKVRRGFRGGHSTFARSRFGGRRNLEASKLSAAQPFNASTNQVRFVDKMMRFERRDAFCWRPLPTATFDTVSWKWFLSCTAGASRRKRSAFAKSGADFAAGAKRGKDFVAGAALSRPGA